METHSVSVAPELGICTVWEILKNLLFWYNAHRKVVRFTRTIYILHYVILFEPFESKVGSFMLFYPYYIDVCFLRTFSL